MSREGELLMVKRDEEVIKQILEYVLDKRYCQAILIDGEWGTGKTFFVKDKLLNRLRETVPQKNIYYVSLYGISSSEQIVDEIYSSMVEEFIEKKLGEDKGKMLEKGISFTSKLFAAGMKYFNLDSKDLPQLSDLKELKEAIIIFDDLERCEIEVNQTLGVLNNLVEHNDIKIILVANQAEIGKMNFSKGLSHKYQMVLDDRVELDEKGNSKNNKVSYTKEQLIRRTEQLFSEDIFYKKVKEKLIGLTIYYQPNLSDVFVAIIDKYIMEDKTKDYLLEHKQKIINIFEQKRHYNIRTLIFGLIAFDKFYGIVDAIEFEPHMYIEYELDRVLKYTMISSIQIKLGQVVYSWGNSSSKSGIVYYDKKNVYESRVYGYKFVDDYLLQCKIDKKEVEKVILENVNEQKIIDDSSKLEKSLQYRKLYSWWELEDEDIEKIIPEILFELQEQKYSPRHFKDIIVTLMQMEYQGISCFDYKDFVELMEQKLKVYTEEFEPRYLEILSDNAEFVEKYNQIVKPLFEILENKEKGEKKDNNDFLCSQEAWDDNFGKRCEEHREEYLCDNKFFYYIEPEKFIDQLQNAKVINIYNFMNGVRKVYNFSNLNEFFKSDVPNIKCILDYIDVEKMNQGKKTRNMALVKLKSKLQEYLELIEVPIYKI